MTNNTVSTASTAPSLVILPRKYNPIPKTNLLYGPTQMEKEADAMKATARTSRKTLRNCAKMLRKTATATAMLGVANTILWIFCATNTSHVLSVGYMVVCGIVGAAFAIMSLALAWIIMLASMDCSTVAKELK